MTSLGTMRVPCPNGCGEVFEMPLQFSLGDDEDALRVVVHYDDAGVSLLANAHAETCTGHPDL